jgi:hypothetical protein
VIGKAKSSPRRRGDAEKIGKAKISPLINTDDTDQGRLPKSPKLKGKKLTAEARRRGEDRGKRKNKNLTTD